MLRGGDTAQLAVTVGPPWGQGPPVERGDMGRRSRMIQKHLWCCSREALPQPQLPRRLGEGGWEKPPRGGTTHLISSCFQTGPSESRATALGGPAAARVGLPTGLA